MGILQKLSDGTVQVTESFDLIPFGTEDERAQFDLAMTEAASKGKKTKLNAKVLGMPGNTITRNFTYYPAEELEASVPSWTNPYPCPFIKDHNEWNVDGIIGRIDKATMASSELWFDVSVIEETAQKNIASGLWAQVSIGTRVKSAVCSVCGNDWAKGTWCEHERGNHYLKDENDPNSVTICYWIMGGLTGRELSTVTTPSAPSAGVKDVNASATEEEHGFSTMILSWADDSDTVESYLDVITESANLGSPVGSAGEATVPSGEEEGVTDADKAAIAASEAEEAPSDVNTEGEEASEDTAETQVDGQGAEGEEGAEASEEGAEGEESEAESEDDAAEGEADPESSADESEGAEGAEGEEAGDLDESDDETTPLVARIAELESQVLTLKAQLYVEAGLRDGFIVGERDALVETHVAMSESTLDELIASVHSRRSTTNVSEELLKHELPTVDENGKAVIPAGVEDDRNAGHDESAISVSVKTEDGKSHSIELIDDTTPVTVIPRISK